MISPALVLSIVFLVVVLLTISKGLKIVPQGTKYVVERLGKYQQTLQPGLNWIIPYLDRVSARVPTKDLVLDIPSQEVITMDNAVIIANAVTFINITDPAKAVYGVEDYRRAIQNLAQTSLRSIIGEMALDETLSNRETIKARLKTSISDDISPWGITLKTVEIQDITPSQTMQASMEEQAAAERGRRATITRAEGQKRAAILEAEGRLEAAKLEAEAKIALARADKDAIQNVAQGLGGDASTAGNFLVATRYLETLEQASAGEGTRTILLPADIQAAVKGLFAKG